MKITYIAKRRQSGKFLCYDIIADGICFNLFLPDGEPLEKIASSIAEWLALRSNVQQAAQSYAQQLLRESDSIEVIKGLLDAEEPNESEETPGLPLEEQTLGEKSEGAIPVFPEGKPGIQWTAVEMQNYMGIHDIEYSDGDKKREMLEKIKEHWGKARK